MNLIEIAKTVDLEVLITSKRNFKTTCVMDVN